MLHDVFISYARQDASSVEPYVRLLRAADLRVWIDENIEPGELAFENIGRALLGSSAVLLFWSRASAQSRWVQQELTLAAELGKQIVPVRLDNRSYNGAASVILAGVQHLNGRTRFPEDDLARLVARIRPQKVKRAPVFAFLNMKGGVGKTTLASNFAGTLHSRFAKSVLAIDLDPQANLSNLLLSVDQYQNLLEYDKSVISAFEPGLVVDSSVSPAKNLRTVTAIVGEPPLASRLAHSLYNPRASERLDLVVGQFELFKYSLSSNFPSLPACRDYFSRFMNAATRQYDAVILDVAPSNSFITECAIAYSSDVIAPVTPDKYALRGLRALHQLLEQAYELEAQPRVHIVANRVTSDVTPTESSIRSEYGHKMLAARIPESSFFAIRNPDENSLVRNPLEALAFHRGQQRIKTALYTMCEEVLAKVGSDEQRDRNP